jgi:hypothetical protein
VGDNRNAYRVPVRKIEGKRTHRTHRILGKFNFMRENNIEIIFKEMMWENLDWIYQRQDRYQCLAL